MTPPRHYEHSAVVATTGERLFAYLDDHVNLGEHMGKPAWMLAGSWLEISLDEHYGKHIGSHVRLTGKIAGLMLTVDEVVTERDPPHRKCWETVGSPQLLVMGRYRMGFEVTPQGAAALLRIFIDYALPDAWPARELGHVLGGFYARWCVRRMTGDAVAHFGPAAAGKECHDS